MRVTTHQYWHLITEKTSENGVSESYNLQHHLHSFPERELYLGCLLLNKQKAKAETSSRCKSLWKQKLFTVLWYQNQRLQQINWLMTSEQNKSSTSEDTFLQWNYRRWILSELHQFHSLFMLFPLKRVFDSRHHCFKASILKKKIAPRVWITTTLKVWYFCICKRIWIFQWNLPTSIDFPESKHIIFLLIKEKCIPLQNTAA